MTSVKHVQIYVHVHRYTVHKTDLAYHSVMLESKHTSLCGHAILSYATMQ